MSAPHSIRRQNLQVKLLGSEQQALQLQARLSAYCRDWLNPALERLFDRMSPTSEYIRIERLSLDLGTLPLGDWEQTLTDAVVEQLRVRLQGLATYKSATSDANQQDADTGAVRSTPEVRLFEAWMQFLETGLLPWSFSPESGQPLQSLIATLLRQPEGISPYQRQRLHDTLRQAAALRRLHLQFDSQTRLRLLLQVAPELITALLEMIGETNAPLHEPVHAPRQHSRKAPQTDEFEEERLHTLLLQHSLLEQLFALWLSTSSGSSQDWRPSLRAYANTAASQIALTPNTPETTDRDAADAAKTTAYPSRATAVNPNHPQTAAEDNAQIEQDAFNPASPDSEQPTIDSATPKRPLAAAERLDASVSDELIAEGIYLDNAGLILLHPFLPQLFSTLGIARDQSIVQPERGLQLLHYLATGQITAPEYQLPLAKLLLNWPLEQPVATLVPLADGDRQEADVLLKAAIRHWSALGDTSPDGLRGTFLLRPGKLSRRENGDWRLQVENQGFDILLNQLPWGFGMIRLPWMPNWLWVEWSY